MRSILVTLTAFLALASLLTLGVDGDLSEKTVVKTVRGKKVCTRGWECSTWSKYCCNETISDFFQTYQFENLFSKRNTPVAHAVGFWDYQAFIMASAMFQPLGFGTTGGKHMQMKEVAAFLAHVGSKTSCEFFHFILFYLLTFNSNFLEMYLGQLFCRNKKVVKICFLEICECVCDCSVRVLKKCSERTEFLVLDWW